jgi:hypothetical protein
MPESTAPVRRRLSHRPLRTVDDFHQDYLRMLERAGMQVFDGQLPQPVVPDFGPPKLEPVLDTLEDPALMELFVKFTRWADYFGAQLANEEILERFADAEVRKLEGLYMLRHKPEKVSEAVTWVRAALESDPEIQAARDAHRVIYARRKLRQMLFESAERDAAVLSRELTRRTDTRAPGYRRADRVAG